MDLWKFQHKVVEWAVKCFGVEPVIDKVERADRFIEEALETYQACGQSKERAQRVMDYVYGRPVGDVRQELGGVMVTLATLANANGIILEDAAQLELERCVKNLDKIRAKHDRKPKFDTPLPGADS